MYWPNTDEVSKTYGHIQVTLLRQDVMATYTIRTLQIRHLKVSTVAAAVVYFFCISCNLILRCNNYYLHLQVKKRKNGVNLGERIVWQYHYTGWPDHGVPEHPLPVLSFIRKSSNANPPDAGPIVVHCR